MCLQIQYNFNKLNTLSYKIINIYNNDDLMNFFGTSTDTEQRPVRKIMSAVPATLGDTQLLKKIIDPNNLTPEISND